MLWLSSIRTGHQPLRRGRRTRGAAASCTGTRGSHL